MAEAKAEANDDATVDEDNSDEDGNLEDQQAKKRKKEKIGFRDRKVSYF